VQRTQEGVSKLSAGTVGLSLLGFGLFYLVLLLLFLFFARLWILQGPTIGE
jgi:cytochrome bd-type quinol oxidase subunit 1